MNKYSAAARFDIPRGTVIALDEHQLRRRRSLVRLLSEQEQREPPENGVFMCVVEIPVGFKIGETFWIKEITPGAIVGRSCDRLHSEEIDQRRQLQEGLDEAKRLTDEKAKATKKSKKK